MGKTEPAYCMECGEKDPTCNHDWVCDEPHPTKTDIRCFQSEGHVGTCSGPNGPVWEADA